MFIHQRLIEPARGLVAEDGGKHFEWGIVGVHSGRRMVRHHDRLVVANAPQCDLTFAILRRLHRISRFELALRAGNGADGLRHPGQRFGFVELTRNEEHGIVRLVILPVERVQPLDRHMLDVGTVANRGSAVVVGRKGSAGHAPV